MKNKPQKPLSLGRSNKEKFAIIAAFLLAMLFNPLTFFGSFILMMTGDLIPALPMMITGTLINIYLAARLIK